MANEVSILKKFYRVLDHIDADGTKWWNRYSFWSRAKDTECEDGETVEDKVGGVKGITTSNNVTETGYLMDAATISNRFTELNNALNNKQNLMRLASNYTSDIDVIGGSGNLPSNDSFCWVQKSTATGTFPSGFGSYGVLFTYKISSGIYLQKLIDYSNGKEYKRTYINSAWKAWGTSYTDDESDDLLANMQTQLETLINNKASSMQTQLETLINNKASSNSVTALETRLTYKNAYTENINDLKTESICGMYWVNPNTASGTHAFTGSYYLFIPVGSGGKTQIAIHYSTGKIKARTYTNNAWQSWTGDAVYTSNFSLSGTTLTITM